MRRDVLNAVNPQLAANAGLWLDCMLRGHGENGAPRRQLIAEAVGMPARALAVYQPAFQRWESSLEGTHTVRRFRTTGRFVTGLGGGGVMEVGLRLHHTYGTPVLPGSGLKGLAAHYFHNEILPRDPSPEAAQFAQTVFGTTKERGFVTFEDSWITPETVTGCLRDDVMTPHEGRYYNGTAGPTGQYDPVPIPFLSIEGTFLVAITCEDRSEAGNQLEQSVLTLLIRALSDWGAGGKTRAGYGRMSLVQG